MRIETERLVLREWREEDVETLYRHASNPIVGRMATAHIGRRESGGDKDCFQQPHYLGYRTERRTGTPHRSHRLRLFVRLRTAGRSA